MFISSCLLSCSLRRYSSDSEGENLENLTQCETNAFETFFAYTVFRRSGSSSYGVRSTKAILPGYTFYLASFATTTFMMNREG